MATAATARELEARWTVLCQTLRVSEAATNKWWTIVRDGMQEKQRHYHTLTHLEELFAHADAFKSHLRDPCAVDLAIFFHDVVYNPRAGGGKNEDDSAVVFSNFAQEVDLEPATLAKVFRWIVQTKHHRCDESDDDDCKFFMDFDMAVLGWERAAYARYAQDVRKEFIHVPEGRREGCCAHNGQKSPPDVGVIIIIIIHKGQSLSLVRDGGASRGWTKTCLVRASVRQSVHSSLFTLDTPLPIFQS